MAKVDHYEIKRMNDEIEMLQEKVNNHQDVINSLTSHVIYCAECDFVYRDDDHALVPVDNGDQHYCETCADKCIERDEVGFCDKCRDCFTIEHLEEIDDDLYCERCIPDEE